MEVDFPGIKPLLTVCFSPIDETNKCVLAVGGLSETCTLLAVNVNDGSLIGRDEFGCDRKIVGLRFVSDFLLVTKKTLVLAVAGGKVLSLHDVFSVMDEKARKVQPSPYRKLPINGDILSLDFAKPVERRSGKVVEQHTVLVVVSRVVTQSKSRGLRSQLLLWLDGIPDPTGDINLTSDGDAADVSHGPPWPLPSLSNIAETDSWNDPPWPPLDYIFHKDHAETLFSDSQLANYLSTMSPTQTKALVAACTNRPAQTLLEIAVKNGYGKVVSAIADILLRDPKLLDTIPGSAGEWIARHQTERSSPTSLLDEPSEATVLIVQLLSEFAQRNAPRAFRGTTDIMREKIAAAEDKIASDMIDVVATTPNLIQYLFTNVATDADAEQAPDERRLRILESKLMRRAICRPSAIRGCKSWLKDCLMETSRSQRHANLARVSHLFDVLSQLGDNFGDGFDAKLKEELLSSLSDSFEQLLPLVLQLSEREMERVTNFSIVKQIVDIKLTQPIALLIVALDGVATIGVLGCLVSFVHLTVHGQGQPTATELNLLVVAYSCNMYRLAREGMQAYAMRKMLSNWLRNNYLDICSIFAILVVDRMVEVDDQVRTAASFRIVATVAVLLQYLDLISFIKLLNIKFATFVLSLSQIMHDLEFFLVVLGLFMLMFGNAFYVMLSSPLDTTGTDEDDESPPFGTISETFLTVFRMMLGDFERGWFTAESESSRVAPFLITLFVLYMFTVMILLLNMLIAIVSGTLVGQFYSNQYLLILIG